MSKNHSKCKHNHSCDHQDVESSCLLEGGDQLVNNEED
jgi:hypothetical protein